MSKNMEKDMPQDLGSYHARSKYKIIPEYQNECCLQIMGITLNFPVLNNHGKTYYFPEDMKWYFLYVRMISITSDTLTMK